MKFWGSSHLNIFVLADRSKR